MRLLADYLLPVLIVALGYVGINRIATKGRWSWVAKLAFHIVGIGSIVVLLLYEYFAGRSLADSMREATGNAFCRVFTIESCPIAIKAEVAQRRGETEAIAAQLSEANAKLAQAQEERRKAEAVLNEAREEKRRAEATLRQAHDAQKQEPPKKSTDEASQNEVARKSIADALSNLILRKDNTLFDNLDRKDWAELDSFYKSRNSAPAWLSSEGYTNRAKTLIARLQRADAEGLEIGDYPVTTVGENADATASAEAELRLSASAMAFSRDAYSGRVQPARLGIGSFDNIVRPSAAELLRKLLSANDVDAAVDALNPPHPDFWMLRKKLGEIRSQKTEGRSAQIPHGPVLQLTSDKTTRQTVLMSDQRVPAVREKLGLPPVRDDFFYDKPLADAVAQFQKEKGLPANGLLTDRTVDALNGNRSDDQNSLIASMERWRWLPRDLGNTYVIVNIPNYTIDVVRGGASIWKDRVVVGAADTATPLLSDILRSVTVNPGWNVPPSLVEQYRADLAKDPKALEGTGIKLTRASDGSIQMYQPPGENNVFGRLRFNLSNRTDIALQDTADNKHLFAHTRRAYSHGCIRLQDPTKLAEILLNIGQPGRGYTQERIRALWGGSEVDIQLSPSIPVHITYQTVFVDEPGNLQIREDIYGYDRRLLTALTSPDRRSASQSGRSMIGESRCMPDVDPTAGQSFFDRLFGNPVRN
jgi:L,D-transpeptidase YcbB